MSNSKEILLLVEDEEAIGEGLKFNFEHEGYEVIWVKNGSQAYTYIAQNHINLSVILLDIMLPEMDGLEILKRTREIAEQIPIVILSAKSQEGDKIKALGLGADDYVTKPFNLVELMLRIKGLSKRRRWYKNIESDTFLTLGKAQFNLKTLTVRTADASNARISPTEGLLAQTFADNENKILTRSDLLEKVWNYDSKMETRTVDVFVSKLRKLIELDVSSPQYLISVRGVGYAYVTDNDTREKLLSSRN